MPYLGEGYLPEKDDKILEQLPSILCLSGDSLIEEIPRATAYINNKHVPFGRPTVKLRAMIHKGVDVDELGKWFKKNIDSGMDWFHAEILFFGVKDVFKCRFINHLKTETVGGLNIAHLELEVDAFHNRFVKVGQTYVLFCDNLIECEAVLNCS